ncbi:MerC domain-containing protein [Croceibacterium ferulae]|uniref:MerC domain-containing protein n=1 Tax=Croceibacterium ferulae TaxID=1854641 RepID=UPI00138FED9B|nr:MerC domain-containing protein [Croceibacterium ferulae]
MASSQPTTDSSLTLLDGFALAASAACMVHCLALPLVLALLPVLSGTLVESEGFHLLVLILALPTSALGLWASRVPGGSMGPLLAGAAGLGLLTLALLAGEAAERVITLAGSLLLAGAHVANWRARRSRR